MDQTLVEGRIYTGTVASGSPRRYQVVRLLEGDDVDLRYGWFGFEDGTMKGLSDPWSWSSRGVQHESRHDFIVSEDLGIAPEAGDARSKFAWAL